MKEYMALKGATLHRDKAVWKYHWILLLPALATLIPGLYHAAGFADAPAWTALFMAFPALVLGLSWLLFTVLRTVVTTDQVKIQYGLWGPTVEVASIESVEITDYPLMRYGGYGIRLGTDGSWAYSLMGQSGKVVAIRYQNDKGVSKKVLVSASDPEELARAIQKAQAMVGKSPEKVAQILYEEELKLRAPDMDEADDAWEEEEALAFAELEEEDRLGSADS